MERLKNLEAAVGKTVASVRNDGEDEIFIKFTDDSFLHLKGTEEYGCVSIDTPKETADYQLVKLGYMTEQEKAARAAQAEAERQQRNAAQRRAEYERLKKEFEPKHVES